MEKKLQYLLDRLAIEDQIKHYAQLVDSKGFDRLQEVMMPGGIIDYRASGGERGTVEEIPDFLVRTMTDVRSQHLMTNVECEIAPDRNSARTTHLLFNPMTIDLHGRDYTYFCGLRYDCDWVRTEADEWKMTSMVQRDAYLYHRPLPPKKN